MRQARCDYLINAALLSAAWIAAVLGGDIVALTACALFAAHILARGHRERDLTIAAVAAAIGLGVDTAWIWLGVLDYHAAPVAPLWIVALWGCVGLSANHAFRGLLGQPWRAASAAAIACPPLYVAAGMLGAVRTPAPWMLLAVAAGWAMLFGVLLGLVAPFFNRQFEETA
jgi:hypothetical protein